jgi:hypothetical protein
MISTTSRAAIQHVATMQSDTTLRTLLALRLGQLVPTEDAHSIRVIVFEAGDTLDALEADLGFKPIETEPTWEWIEAHLGWFELAYVFSDDGDGAILFVSRAEGVAPDLLALCSRWSVT